MDDRQQETYQMSERHRQILDSLRLRVKELEGENKALQGQTKQLQDVVVSQQQTIQEFQKIIQRQQAQIDQATVLNTQEETRNVKGAPGKPPGPQPWTAFQGRQEQAQPLQASIVDNGVQHNTRAMRSREGSARESSRKSGGSASPGRAPPSKPAPTIVNGVEKGVTVARPTQPVGPGGKYWQTIDGIAAQGHGNPSVADPKVADKQDQPVAVDNNAEDAESKHRRIVSDPPPLESWHLGAV